MTHEEMLRTGVALVRAMMRSASTDTIRPIDWWTRAQSALVRASESSSTFSALVSTMGKALQIDTLRSESAADVAFLADEIAPAHLDAWIRFLGEEALYVVALAQVERKAERAANQRPARQHHANDVSADAATSGFTTDSKEP